MNKEKDILCRTELLGMLLVAGDKNRMLSKMQIIYLHYLIRNQTVDDLSLNNLKRYHRMNLFNLCDYDSNIKRLVLKEFVDYELKSGKLVFKISEKGRAFLNTLKSPFFIKSMEKIKKIFSSTTNERKLREEVLSMVKITR